VEIGLCVGAPTRKEEASEIEADKVESQDLSLFRRSKPRRSIVATTKHDDVNNLKNFSKVNFFYYDHHDHQQLYSS
jgi:hypothetical protein